MTRPERARALRGLDGRGWASAVLIALAAILIGWLCVRAALLRMLPPTSATLTAAAPHDPGVVLARTADALVRKRGILSPAELAAVRRAATRAPLDARAFLVIGHQHLLEGDGDRALATLEEGQRLDPRQALIHILLLDRYARTERYAEVGTQLSVLTRLIGPTSGPAAAAAAAMILAPETRSAVRRTLVADPALERAVLTTLARSDTPPATIFALASPAARADAADADSWGPALVTRLVAKEQFARARAVWQRIYGVRDGAAIFDAGFTGVRGSPPFNWTLAAGSIGAADIRQNALVIDYYGRDNGDLASQLLVLAPGRYRFTITIEAGATDAAARLAWTLTCATGDKASLMTLPVAARKSPRRAAAVVTVPVGCPAQQLALRGESGDLPVPANLTLRRPEIVPLPGTAS